MPEQRLQKIAQMKLRNFLKDPPPERRSHANKRDSMSNGDLFSSEWQQIDRVIDEVKGEGGRVCQIYFYIFVVVL